MTTITSTDTAVQTPFDDVGFDDPQIAAPSFLARYSGRIPEPTVCGFYRFAHIDGRIGPNPAEYIRRPQAPPPTLEGSIGLSLVCSWPPPTTTTSPTRRWPCRSA